MRKEEIVLRSRGRSVFVLLLLAAILIAGVVGVFTKQTVSIANSGIHTYTGAAAQILGIGYVFLSFLILFATGAYRNVPIVKNVQHHGRKKIVMGLLISFVIALVLAISTEVK